MMQLNSIPSLAQFRSLIQQRLGLDLSGEEIAELVWMAIAQGLETSSEIIQKETEPITETINLDNRTTVPSMPVEPPPSVPIASPVSATVERSLDHRGGMSVQIPDAIGLRNRKEIERSLRPLMRKVPSQRQRVMLEEETARRIAQTQIWEAVMGPEPERWLDLAIVIEVTNVYAGWRETLEEFRILLERHGAFRAVKTWHLKANALGDVELFLQRGRREGMYSAPRNPRELLSGNGRRLVLVMSDCTSASWRSQRIPNLLKLWSQENPVTIVQLLPPMHWDRTALRSGVAVGLRSAVPGALSRDWRVEGLSAVRRRRLPIDGLKLPVVTIDPVALGTWARAMGSIGDGMTAGVMLEISPLAPNSGGTGVREVTGEEVVRRFRSTASGEAQELAAVLAMFPVTNAVVRLVQKVVLEESAALFLAEMVLSGVVVAIEGRSGQDYDFADGVRSALVSRLESAVALDVADEVAEEVISQLPNAEEVRARISADIERRYGESLRSFEAFLIPDLDWGDEAVKGSMMAFGSVAESVLRTWGGEFGELCDRLMADRTVAEEMKLKWARELGIRLVSRVVTVAQICLLSDTSRNAIVGSKLKNITATSKLVPIVTVEKIGSDDKGGDKIGQDSKLLQEFEFELVKLDDNGNINYREIRSASYFIEPLRIDVLPIQLVSIPGGTFMMGSLDEDMDSRDREKPRHKVTLQSFFISRYPITQSQWQAVANYPQIDRAMDPHPSRFQGENRPVEWVSWDEAQEFCKRLSFITGKAYCLPSEAQWEYACRSGSETAFSYGQYPSSEMFSYQSHAMKNAVICEPLSETSEVGLFPANNWGLHDMHGHVWEFCEDDWHRNYVDAPTDGSAWVNEDRDGKLVIRGGSWDQEGERCRSAARAYYNIFDAHANNNGTRIGFRICCMSPFI